MSSSAYATVRERAEEAINGQGARLSLRGGTGYLELP
jgi:hypothetical protein